jgi:hypothetical protein
MKTPTENIANKTKDYSSMLSLIYKVSQITAKQPRENYLLASMSSHNF